MGSATTPRCVLADGAIYSGDNGRLLCRHPRCAGSTAQATGYDLSGHAVLRMGTGDVREWAAVGLGHMRCGCGRVTLSQVAGPGGWPLAFPEKGGAQ
jgi:hypothetical protein